MKSKEVQTAVKNKYENGDGPSKIYRDLAGVVSLQTIKLWIKMIKNTGTIKFVNWVLNNYTKEDTEKWLFTDEKYFDLDGVYNVQNDQVWAVSREEADKKGGVHQKSKYPAKVMVWLGVCGKGLTMPVILEDETMNAERYIQDVLPIALKCGNNMLGTNWAYQQDGARPHTHSLSQKWCHDHFPAFIPKIRWPPNSPDLCPLDYSLWNELAQAMNWDHITTKGALVDEIKRSIKKVEKEKILLSVRDFTVRLRSIQKNGGNYIR
ncbi:unnamed protein product [Didymodactylos carnosus]|uniref:Transposase n=1 Tax=Didymodactylos carnosus TaxID=1234261 RepID=A0A8S2F834_9BILA|nr:unnamed protein product [Didymodactylos carnosus]CAF4199382.1 unnamed protein product [Didymodactylos carnosus]